MLNFSQNNKFNTTSAFCQAYAEQSEHPLSPDFANECENFFTGNFQYFAKPCMPEDEAGYAEYVPVIMLTTAAVLGIYAYSKSKNITQAEIEPAIVVPLHRQ